MDRSLLLYAWTAPEPGSDQEQVTWWRLPITADSPGTALRAKVTRTRFKQGLPRISRSILVTLNSLQKTIARRTWKCRQHNIRAHLRSDARDDYEYYQIEGDLSPSGQGWHDVGFN